MLPPPDSPDPVRLRPSGGFRKLRAFQTTTVIYDGTVAFCIPLHRRGGRKPGWAKFVRSHKLADQLIGAARSGRQNIGEGSRTSAASAESELKLVQVARASQDELLLDYEDYLRQKRHRQWHKDDPEAMAVRGVAKVPDNRELTYTDYAPWLDHADPAQRANCLICLIHQANYLLDRLLVRLEKDLITGGGYREQLTQARLAERDRQAGLPVVPKEETPNCPKCSKPMRLRTAKQGGNAGSRFWGCSGYPECKGTRKYQPGSSDDHKLPGE
ncbi:MAG: topoisomerase DNA-binding C4 zinc finger domain-containing protein [Bacteroidetes bacterium]|nr:topoisomerase DNA-binding C4 zinc finger domain-containing protein [Bacteroidota bacterium]